MSPRTRNRNRQPQVRRRGELTPPAGYDSLVSVGAGINGPVALWTSTEDQPKLLERDEQPGWASFPYSKPSVEPAVALVAYTDSVDISTVVQVARLPVTYPHVQQFPDGSFLVVGARCRWNEAGAEQNAIVIGRDGQLRRQGCLGDGLQHVQVTEDGVIWTGYFDEGVFGNLGWGEPDGPTPLGAAGIVAWSSTLDKIWELDRTDVSVADCYALNATQSTVWACPYTDFPVVRIVDGRAHVHPSRDVSGPSGIIATRDRVGIIGTYGDPSQLIVGHLTDDRFVETDRTRLRTPDGTPIPRAEVYCRGSVAHFFADRTWYSFDLTEHQ